MTYPLDEPHLAALRWAAMALRDEPAKAARLLEAIRGFKHLVTKLIPENEAMLALSSPSSAAQLVRDLLGACGATGFEILTFASEKGPGIAVSPTSPPIPALTEHFWMQDVPALILSLLDALALPDGRAEAALKALREVGR